MNSVAAQAPGYQSPFAQPTITVTSADFSSILLVVFLIVFLMWVIYTLVVSYHWFKYGHRSWLALPAIGVHVVVSAIFIILMATGI